MIAAAARRLGRDERGATIVEFGLILIPLMTIMLGLIDLGFQQYIALQMQGALDEAAREVTVGNVPQSQIETLLRNRVHDIWPAATVSLTPQSFDNFSHVGKPEPVTTDVNGNGTYDPGDCFLDINGNGKWDAAVTSGTGGTGGGDDIVFYTATATYPEIMPVSALLGWSSTTTLTANMMMRNQPYAAQPQPKTVCK